MCVLVGGVVCTLLKNPQVWLHRLRTTDLGYLLPNEGLHTLIELQDELFWKQESHYSQGSPVPSWMLWMTTAERFTLLRKVMEHLLQPKSLQSRATKHQNIQYLHNQLAQWVTSLRSQVMQTGWIRISASIFLCFPSYPKMPQDKGSLNTSLFISQVRNLGPNRKEEL